MAVDSPEVLNGNQRLRNARRDREKPENTPDRVEPRLTESEGNATFPCATASVRPSSVSWPSSQVPFQKSERKGCQEGTSVLWKIRAAGLPP